MVIVEQVVSALSVTTYKAVGQTYSILWAAGGYLEQTIALPNALSGTHKRAQNVVVITWPLAAFVLTSSYKSMMKDEIT